MGTPTRFTFGVTNVAKATALGMMGQLDPTKIHTYFNDFDTYTAANWTVTETGTAGTTTQALTAGDGGLLLLTNSAGGTDATYMQLDVASFLMATGKKAFFKTRFKVDDATNTTVQMGLVITDTSPIGATDGIYFQKDSTATAVDVYCRKDATTGSTSATGITTMADDTFIELGWYYDGRGTVYAYANDVVVARLDASSTYLPDATLNVSMGLLNASAAAHTMTVDYILAAKER